MCESRFHLCRFNPLDMLDWSFRLNVSHKEFGSLYMVAECESIARHL